MSAASSVTHRSRPSHQIKKPLLNRLWFKTVIVILFIFTPVYTVLPHSQGDTASIISAVLGNPLAYSIDWLLPVAKLALLGFAVVLPLIIQRRLSGRVLLGYYATIVAVVSVFQNISTTDKFGLAWVAGSTIIQLFVVAVCVYDISKNLTQIDKKSLVSRRLWLAIPMALSYLMPYAVDSSGSIAISFSGILTNEAGLTYCMITPVVIGMMLLFPGKINRSTLSIISFVGLLFALANMMTWFFLQPENWWMGVLHLPLLVTSVYGIIVSRLSNNRPLRVCSH